MDASASHAASYARLRLVPDIIYAGVPLERHDRLTARLARRFRRSPEARTRPAVVPRDDRAVRDLEAAFLALPEGSREEVRARLMQAIVTFQRTNDVAPLLDFVESVLITAKLNSNPRYRAALKEAESDSWDNPVTVEAMIEAADERRRAAQGLAR